MTIREKSEPRLRARRRYHTWFPRARGLSVNQWSFGGFVGGFSAAFICLLFSLPEEGNKMVWRTGYFLPGFAVVAVASLIVLFLSWAFEKV